MHKSLIGLAAAAASGWPHWLSGTANAGCYGCAVGAGVLGGVAAGAIIGSAIANSPPPPPPGLLSAAAASPGCYPRGRVMPSSHRAATGESAGFGLRATATRSGPSRSVGEQLLIGSIKAEFGRPA